MRAAAAGAGSRTVRGPRAPPLLRFGPTAPGDRRPWPRPHAASAQRLTLSLTVGRVARAAFMMVGGFWGAETKGCFGKKCERGAAADRTPLPALPKHLHRHTDSSPLQIRKNRTHARKQKYDR